VLLVVAGPSGVGKGTIVRELLARDPDLWESVSVTTRAPRAGEVDGREYWFVSDGDFERRAQAGGFLESFSVYDARYGTPREPVEERLAAGGDVVLEIDVQGALAVRDAFPDAVLVFVRAPSREVQKARLLTRDPDADPEALERRLAVAAAEEAQADQFDLVVVNDDLPSAVAQVETARRARGR